MVFTERDVIQLVGRNAFSNGAAYLAQGRVASFEVDLHEGAMSTEVRGSGSRFYTTSVKFSYTRDGSIVPTRSLCSCPVSFNCKHGAAVMLAFLSANAQRASATRQAAQAPLAPPVPPWQRLLDKIAESEDSPSRDTVEPIGLQFELLDPRKHPVRDHWGRPITSHSGSYRLGARPVVRSESGNWVRTGVAWNKISPSRRGSRYNETHLDWLRSFDAVGSTEIYDPYYYDPSWLMLDTFQNPLFWDLLEQAQRIGLPLLNCKKNAPPVGLQLSGTSVAVDTVQGTRGLNLRARVTLGGSEVDGAHVGYLGAPAHGLFTWQGTGEPKTRTLTLARLESSIPSSVLELLTADKPVNIPKKDAAAFATNYLPKLQSMVPVVSSDNSIEIPDRARPRLVVKLRAAQTKPEKGAAKAAAEAQPPSPAIAVELSWEYVDAAGRAMEGADPDPKAEHAVIASLELPYHRYPALVEGDHGFAQVPVADGSRKLLQTQAMLSGMRMVTFLVEEVPRLAKNSGVRIERDAAIPEYQESAEPVEVSLSIAERDGDRDWFNLVAEVAVDGERIPFSWLFVALANNEPYLVLPSGTFCSLQDERFARLKLLIEEARRLGEVDGDTVSISRFQADLWSEFEALGVVAEQAEAWQKMVSGLSDHATIRRQKTAAGFTAQLRHYQQDGYDWLTFLYENGLGGVLADDMGLGKTIQTLALVSKQSKRGTPPFLVVAPTSVVGNWAAEAAKFAPKLKVVAIDSTVNRAGAELTEIVGKADLVITSYALFRIDLDHYEQLNWVGLILDEAQFAKNHQSGTYRAARMLSAPFKLAITGTPMENNLMELWSMFSITAPGLFSSPTHFNEYYQKPIEKEGNTERLEQLKRRIRPLMLRRTKELVVSELPPKQEQVLLLDLNPAQRAVYDTYLQRERQKVLGLMEDMDSNRFQIFRSLTLLRQAALDVSLVDEEHTGVPSTKVEALLEMLQEIGAEGHRTLIFSQFTSFLGVVRDRLEADGIDYEYLDGTTTRRASVIKRFREGDAPVFLISLKSGGFGLNLTEADYCVLLDPWWNPAAESQAVDRAHRIGQTKQVMVYRFVARDTIEEKVMALKAGKDKLFESVMGGGELASAALTADDIRELLG